MTHEESGNQPPAGPLYGPPDQAWLPPTDALPHTTQPAAARPSSTVRQWTAGVAGVATVAAMGVSGGLAYAHARTQDWPTQQSQSTQLPQGQNSQGQSDPTQQGQFDPTQQGVTQQGTGQQSQADPSQVTPNQQGGFGSGQVGPGSGNGAQSNTRGS